MKRAAWHNRIEIEKPLVNMVKSYNVAPTIRII